MGRACWCCAASALMPKFAALKKADEASPIRIEGGHFNVANFRFATLDAVDDAQKLVGE